MKTGRDVVIGALLGAEMSFGFATAPLVVEGCIMMRKCHLNTCPVGVATQDPVLRAKFTGKPEHVVNYFFFVAEKRARSWRSWASASSTNLIGRADLLDTRKGIALEGQGLDFSRVFHQAGGAGRGAALPPTETQDHGLAKALDVKLIEVPVRPSSAARRCSSWRTRATSTAASAPCCRANWSAAAGRPADDTIFIQMEAPAGSRSAPSWPGITLYLIGDANDYTGKGLSGGRVVVRPAIEFPATRRKNIIIGNTRAVWRHQRRGPSSAAWPASASRCACRAPPAVVEGTGDHGCEYMTGGTVVVLGRPATTSPPACRAAWPTSTTRTASSLALQPSMVALDKVLPRMSMGRARRVGWHRRPRRVLLKKLIEDHHAGPGRCARARSWTTGPRPASSSRSSRTNTGVLLARQPAPPSSSRSAPPAIGKRQRPNRPPCRPQEPGERHPWEKSPASSNTSAGRGLRARPQRAEEPGSEFVIA